MGNLKLTPADIKYAPPLTLTEEQQERANKYGVQLLNVSSCWNGCRLKQPGIDNHNIAVYSNNPQTNQTACFNKELTIDKFLDMLIPNISHCIQDTTLILKK